MRGVQPMQTEFYDSDPFSGSKGKLILTLDTDYRFERGDEFTVRGSGNAKFRVTFVRITIENGRLSREIVGMKI
jgi:hypothetical protein